MAPGVNVIALLSRGCVSETEMPVLFPPHADLVLVAITIATIFSGVTAGAIFRNSSDPSVKSATPHLAVFFFMRAIIAAFGVYRLSEPRSGLYYAIPVALFVLTCIPLLLAAASYAKPGAFLARGRIPLCVLLVVFAPVAGFAASGGLWPVPLDDTRFADAVFVIVKSCLWLFCLLLAWTASRSPKNPPRNLSRAYWLLAVVGALSLLSLSPATPSDAGLGGFMPPVGVALTQVLHIGAIYGVAALLWSVYAKTMGAGGRAIWWPFAIMAVLACLSLGFMAMSGVAYAKVVERDLTTIARNLAAIVPPEALLPPQAFPDDDGRMTSSWRIFEPIRTQRLSVGDCIKDISVDAVKADAGDGRPMLFPGDAGMPRRLGPRLAAMWEEGRTGKEVVSNLFDPENHRAFVLEPVRHPQYGVVGATLLGVPTEDLALDLFRHKRAALLILSLAFLGVILLLQNQVSAWLALRSATRSEAMRLGSLGHDLVGVAITRDEVVTHVNQRLLDLLGTRHGDLLHRNIFDVLGLGENGDGDRREAIRTLLGSGGGGAHLEEELRPKTGVRLHALLYVRRQADETAPNSHVWEVVDVTRQIAMERQARTARDFLQTVIDALPISVFVKSTDGRYLMANHSFAGLLGVSSPDEVLGRTMEELHPSAGSIPGEYDELCRLMRGDTLVYDFDFDFSGRPRFMEVAKTLRRTGPEASDAAIIGTVHDLTSRKNLTDAIARERHFLRQILNTMSVSVCFTDTRGVIRMADDDFAREAGAISPETLIGRPFVKASPYPDPVPEEDKRLLAAGGGFSDTEFTMKDGERTRHFMLRRTVMSSQEGEVLGLVKTYWDTSAIVAANRAATAAQRARTAFLSNMSHELRTPMNGIMGMADIILSRETTLPETRLGIDVILKSAKTLQMVMDEIMDIASLELRDKRMELAPGAVDLLELAEDTVRVESCIAEAWGVELFLDYDLRLRSCFRGDGKRIRQVLVQMVAHCARVSRQDLISLRVSPSPAAGEGAGRVSFRVVFSPVPGVGAPDLEAQFKKGYLSGQNPAFSARLGIFDDRIGLPLAWRLIQAMNGSLAVQAEGGGELTCEVVLPLEPIPNSPPSLVRPDLSEMRVAVMSGDAGRGRVLESCLAYAGASVTVAGDIGALESRLLDAAGGGHPVHLVIADTRGGDLDGLAALLAKARHAEEYGRPHVLLAVHAWDIQPGFPVGGDTVNGYLPLPLCPSDIWAKADNIRHRIASIGSRGGADGADAIRRPTALATGTMKFDASILLVDDNIVNQLVGRGMLGSIGCRVELARDGSEAVEAVTRGSAYDMILMDCNMPTMDGYEAAAAIREFERIRSGAARHIIVALTANDASEDRERCLAAGMDDYMAKPITLAAMRDMLLRHCPSRMSLTAKHRDGA